MNGALVALGDSITVGEADRGLGVAGRSWALWLAEALDVAFRSYAVSGVTAPQVLADQLPRVQGEWAYGALYVGANDVRSVDFDLDAYARDTRALVEGLRARVGTLLVGLLPEDLGRPTSAPKPARANAHLRALAAEHGAVVADWSGLGGWRHVMPDHVHPTAAGQLHMADVAARALGVPAHALPSAGSDLDTSAKAAVRYLPRQAGLLQRDWRRRWRER